MRIQAEGERSREKEREPWLQWGGRLAAPALALAVWAVLPTGEGGLSEPGRWTTAVAVLMAVLWITEAIPLPATSLLPIVLLPLGGASTLGETTAAYGNEVIFLFMGGFILALGLERWGLHRRVALRVLSLVGTRPASLIGGFMAAAAFLSMWINNTATTLMMLPIGLSTVRLVQSRAEEHGQAASRWAGFSTALMLGIAYAASVGSLGTLVGTAPNLFLRGFVQRTYGIEFGFGTWMAAVMPLSVALLVVTWALLVAVFVRDRKTEVPGGAELVRGELARLGPMQRGEQVLLAVFVLTALAWITREPLTSWKVAVEVLPWLPRVTDAGIAMAAAIALFMIPVDARKGVFAMNWETAERLPWGVLLLFGGGLALAGAIQRTGLDRWIGQQLTAVAELPLWLVVVLVVASVVFLTELTSNTAVAATFLPVLGGVAVENGISPLTLLVPATLAATCAFMLPVATPPNAIVFGTGAVTMRQMTRAGLLLNLAAITLISVFAFTTARLLAQ
jgi:solute carrier family 13 (sodium-dependent dicarboxylate transporter), member 2/3/5